MRFFFFSLKCWREKNIVEWNKNNDSEQTVSPFSQTFDVFSPWKNFFGLSASFFVALFWAFYREIIRFTKVNRIEFRCYSIFAFSFLGFAHKETNLTSFNITMDSCVCQCLLTQGCAALTYYNRSQTCSLVYDTVITESDVNLNSSARLLLISANLSYIWTIDSNRFFSL